jgi:N-formylglutamate amidohydrolase
MTMRHSGDDGGLEAAGSVPAAELYRQPFRIVRPQSPTAPLVFAVPHAGRLYPDDFLAGCLLKPPLLRRSEDAYADRLFGGAAAHGPMICARYPRALVDPNRAPEELDPRMFDDPPPAPVTRSARVEAGFGVIPRLVQEGAALYDRRLSPLEAVERIDRLHRPYHAALAALLAETRDRFGCAALADCHTMPDFSGAADIVLGDRRGASAPAELMHLAETAFRAEGFTVALNAPYAGGYTLARHACGRDGIHAFQIEVNRALYLDEAAVMPGADFDAICERIARAVRLIALDAPDAIGTQKAQAAE